MTRRKESDNYRICTIAVTFSVDMDRESAADYVKSEAQLIKERLVRENPEFSNVKVNYSVSEVGDYSTPTTVKRSVKHTSNNLNKFLFSLQGWRPWDYQYTIEFLVKLLEEQAIDLKNDIWHLHAMCRYKDCKYAAHLLKEAYLGDQWYDDKTLNYLTSKRKMNRTKLENGNIAVEFYYDDVTERIADGMNKAAMNRLKKTCKEKEEFVWDFIGKHIKEWWS